MITKCVRGLIVGCLSHYLESPLARPLSFGTGVYFDDLDCWKAFAHLLEYNYFCRVKD